MTIIDRKLCVILGVFALLVAPCGCRRQIETPLPIAVQVATLQREVVNSERRFTASVREKQRIELSFKVPGTIASMLQVADSDGKPRDLHEGDEVVARGQPLIRLDDADYQRRVATARERLAQAQAKQRAAEAMASAVRISYERMQSLRDQGAIARQTYDDTLARRDSAEAELEAAGREITAATVARQQAEDDLKNCSLILPIERATVSKKYVELGERVQGGQPVLEVMDLAGVRVAFGVPDTKVGQFNAGQTLTVMADAFPGEKFTGRVSKIQPAADLRTRSFEIEVTIDEPRGLRPGMVVSLVTSREQTAVLLPMTAIGRGETPDEPTVFVVADENGSKVVHKRRIAIDGVCDNRIKLVEDGRGQVREGDVIVVTGAFRLSEGQKVTVVPPHDLALIIGL
jgi:RND family efflux transporter MFP subunit